MSTPSGGSDDPWVQPGDPTRPVPPPPPPPPPGYGAPPEPAPPGYGQSPPTGYGTPSSPSYGRYGQGEAIPPTAPLPSGSPSDKPYGSPSDQPVWGEPAPGQQQWAQPQWGQPQYVNQPPWSNGVGAFRASGGLGVAVIVMSVLLTVVYWISALISSDADRQYEAAVAEGRSVDDVFTAYDTVGILSLPVLIGAWFVSCVWLGRARNNALLLVPGGQRRSAVWVWLGWLLPFVSLWFPKQILDDTIKATAPAAGVRPFATGWYWASWIVMNLLSNAQFRLTFQAEPQDAVIPGLEFAIAIATTVALVFWALLVQRISAVQDKLAANGVVGHQPTDGRPGAP